MMIFALIDDRQDQVIAKIKKRPSMAALIKI
jgi:hypothetical protein